MTLRDRLRQFENPKDDRSAWRPRHLCAAHPEQAAQLEALLDSGRVRAVHDTLDAQLVDLAKIRNPGLRSGRDDHRLRACAALLLGDAEPHEYGEWVFYPWSGRLVHVLPRDEFRELRADRNRNKITRAEQATLASLTVGVVGLSVGQATALTLAMEGVGGRFRIADFDVLDLSNLNRLRAGVHEIGLPKVFITAREIFEIDPYADVEIYPQGITRDNVDDFLTTPSRLDFVAEECDDLMVKILLRERARAHRIAVIMETSDRGMVDIERFDREPDRPLLHGLVGDLRASDLEGLTTLDKVPTVLQIIGPRTVSKRMAASMLDVDSTLASWPQLASAVALGGAVVTDVARRMALGQLRVSGRYYVDPEEIVVDGAPSREVPAPSYAVDTTATPPTPPPPIVPHDGGPLRVEQVRTLVAYGVLAPSGGNCQPWRFEYEAGVLRCYHDEERSRSLLDFDNVASTLAFGAAIHNIELAAAAMGVAVVGEPFADPHDRRLVCALRLSPGAPTVRDPLLAFVATRCTNRRRDGRQPLPGATLDELRGAASAAGARLQLCTEPEALADLGAIIGEGDRLRLLSPTMHAEMMAELRWSAAEAEHSLDGIDVATLELSRADMAGLRLLSSWPLMDAVGRLGAEAGVGLGRGSRVAIDNASAVGLISVPGITPTDYLRAGMAVQRVWLTATSLGLAFQPMTVLAYLFARVVQGGGKGLRPHEIATLTGLRQRMGQHFAMRDDHAHAMLIRLAKAEGPPTVRSLRRPVDEVLRVIDSGG